MNDVKAMCIKLGLPPEAPKIVLWMQTAITFFRSHLAANPFEWVSYFEAIDFHSKVRAEPLPAGLKISRHAYVSDSFCDAAPKKANTTSKNFLYFTVPGTSQFSTGTSFDKSKFEIFEVSEPIYALVSTASSVSFDRADSSSLKDTKVRVGGGKQYIIRSSDFSRLRKL